jgi:Ca-activated chloride channel family protein
MHLPITFLYPAAFLLGLLGVGLLWARGRRQPAVVHSQVGIQKDLKGFPIVGWLPTVFYSLFVISVVSLLAWAVRPEDKEKRYMDTRDIIIAVDMSGSMGSAIQAGPPEGLDWPAEKGQFRRIDLAQWAVQQFVARRKGDRVGLMVFDDATYKHWPMTDDLKIIVRKSDLISRYIGGGTNFEGPTETDKRWGPLQSAIQHFQEYGQARTKVLIFVTDGEAPISDKRMEEIIKQMKALGGKVYVLGVGEDWTNQGQNSFQSAQLEPIKKLVAALGGKCFAVGDAKEMQEALTVVDQLEKSQIVLERTTTFQDAYQYFAAASVISLLLLALAVLVTREVV